jgi:hypothetical protein
MGQRNSDRIVDFRSAAESRVEVLSVELPNDFEADLAWNLPIKYTTREITGCFAADVNGERRRGVMEELFGMVVGENYPEIGI